MYQALLFDLDDTLYDLRSYWRDRLRRSLDLVIPHFPQFDREELVRTALSQRVYMAHWPQFLRSLGVADEELIAHTHRVFCEGWFDEMHLYPETPAVLKELGKRYRLGLITNGPSDIQRRKIERFELSNYFEILVVSEEVGVEKPDPSIFLTTLERLGVPPTQALYVGDSPEFDLRGAAAAGMDAIWMNPRRAVLPTDLTPPRAMIERLADLLDVLA